MATISQVLDVDGEHIGWRVQIRKKGYKPQYKTFRTKREAQAWAAVVESEMVRGVPQERCHLVEGTPVVVCDVRFTYDGPAPKTTISPGTIPQSARPDFGVPVGVWSEKTESVGGKTIQVLSGRAEEVVPPAFAKKIGHIHITGTAQCGSVKSVKRGFQVCDVKVAYG